MDDILCVNVYVKCKKELRGKNKDIYFKVGKVYPVSWAMPDEDCNWKEDLIVIDEQDTEHIVAIAEDRIFTKDEWFNEYFDLVLGEKEVE